MVKNGGKKKHDFANLWKFLTFLGNPDSREYERTPCGCSNVFIGLSSHSLAVKFILEKDIKYKFAKVPEHP